MRNNYSLIEDSFREVREYGRQTVTVTQHLSAFSKYKPKPAFQNWIERLKPGDRLPRGRYFTGKKTWPSFVVC